MHLKYYHFNMYSVLKIIELFVHSFSVLSLWNPMCSSHFTFNSDKPHLKNSGHMWSVTPILDSKTLDSHTLLFS